jgi:hypothetical protein
MAKLREAEIPAPISHYRGPPSCAIERPAMPDPVRKCDAVQRPVIAMFQGDANAR